MPQKITPEEYKKRFNELYPNYELLSNYLGDKEYIIVRCKLDGNVWKTKPNWLKHGTGCQKCYDRRRGETTRVGTEEFIKRAREIHGDKYDYSKVNYVNNKTPVTLICPKHGDFLIRPDKHISLKQGCSKCAFEKNGINKRLSQEQFIEKAREIHGDKYDYSKVEYTGWNCPVTIICPKHGEFKQVAGNHLLGCGCPFCNQSHLETQTKKTLLENKINFEQQKRFDWLGRQSLDFYLPDYNIAIECQGLQHYSEYYFSWNQQSSLNSIIKRDENKNILCKENGVVIYYISKSKKILEISTIYTKENTFTNVEDIIKKLSNNGLFETIVKEICKSLT